VTLQNRQATQTSAISAQFATAATLAAGSRSSTRPNSSVATATVITAE
jgi:hypothetical protein